MTTVAVTNYGTLLKKATTVLGEVVSINPPKLTNATVEATNHSSGGWREFVSSMLRELEEFTAVVNFTPAVMVSGIVIDLQAGTKASYSITFPDTSVWTSDCYVTGFAPETADAQNPDALKAEVTFRPTGTPTFA